jgi:hypothetical protein
VTLIKKMRRLEVLVAASLNQNQQTLIRFSKSNSLEETKPSGSRLMAKIMPNISTATVICPSLYSPHKQVQKYHKDINRLFDDYFVKTPTKKDIAILSKVLREFEAFENMNKSNIGVGMIGSQSFTVHDEDISNG